MNQLVPINAPSVPALVATAGERASIRFLEFFTANIRNPHTRRAYARAAEEFLTWCAAAGVRLIVWCRACRRHVEPDPVELAERYGAAIPVLGWKARLVCSGCGSSVDMVVTGTKRP